MRVETYRGNIKKYYCGRDLLVLEEDYLGETFIVVTMDANECTIMQVGKNLEILWHKESYVARKHDAGGQSQRRFERGRDNELVQWLKEVAIKLQEVYNSYKVILGGPTNTKLRVLNYLNEPTKDKIIAIVDTGDTSPSGVWEVIEKSKEKVKQCLIVEEKHLGDEFAMLLSKDPDMVDYGPNFDKNNVKLVLLSDKNKDKYPDLPTKIVRHSIVDALGICVFKRYSRNF